MKYDQMTMKNFRTILIFCISLIFWTSHLVAQETEWEKIDEGSIEDASFIVEKSLEIELPQQNRAFEKVPPLPSSSSTQLNQAYNYLTILPRLQGINIPSRVLKLKSEPLDKFYGGNISAGFGNYLTPFIDASLFNKRENAYALGLNFQHISSRNGPVDKENSGSSNTRAGFESKYYGEKLTVGADLTFDRQKIHYYGYPDTLEVDRDSIKQFYNTFDIGLWFGNTNKKDDFDYRVSAEYSNIKDHFDSRESRTQLGLQSNYFLREGLSFYLDVYTMISSYKVQESLSRNLIKVKPYVYYRYNDFDIRGGFNFVIQNDTLSSRGEVLLFPFIQVDYALNDYFSLFLKLDGDLEQVDFHSMADQNPYLDQGVALIHSNRRFGIDWGIKGNVNNYFNFLAGFRLSDYKDLYFFMNDSLDISRFDILYEHENSTLMNIYGEVVYSRIKEYNIAIRADYYGYDTKSLAEPWHRPKYMLTGTFRYNVYDKIVFGSNIYFKGGIKAFDYTAGKAITLSGIVDLNLSVKYLFSERLGALLRFDNILGKNYEQYWRYPSRGIQILGGFSFNF